MDIYTILHVDDDEATYPQSFLDTQRRVNHVQGYLIDQLIDCPAVVRAFLHLFGNLKNVLWSKGQNIIDSMTGAALDSLSHDNTKFRLFVQSFTGNGGGRGVTDYVLQDVTGDTHACVLYTREIVLVYTICWELCINDRSHPSIYTVRCLITYVLLSIR